MTNGKKIELVDQAEYLPSYENNLVSSMIQEVNKTSIVSSEDGKFLLANSENFKSILNNTYIWRTWGQKLSIISDDYHPTLHSKFHQVILETKVFFENMVQLSLDAEKLKIEVRELELDIENLKEKYAALEEDSIKARKNLLKQERINIDLKAKIFQYEQAKVAMLYRIKELKQWKDIQDHLFNQMLKAGFKPEEIWNKEVNELEDQFYLFLNNLKGLNSSTDAGEVNNLIALAKHAVAQAKASGKFDYFKSKCNSEQLAHLNFIENFGNPQPNPEQK